MADLARLHQFIQRRLSSSANCLVVPACDLLAGKKGASLEKALAAFSSWGTVHGPNASYTRMALALVDSYFGKTAPAAPVMPKAATQQLKRQRAESSTSYESGSEAGQPIPALSSLRLPVASPVCAASRGAVPADPGTPSRAATRGAASTAAAGAAAAGSELLFTVTDTLYGDFNFLLQFFLFPLSVPTPMIV